eukprot:8988527-Pyramimonas_sp.AAC.1
MAASLDLHLASADDDQAKQDISYDVAGLNPSIDELDCRFLPYPSYLVGTAELGRGGLASASSHPPSSGAHGVAHSQVPGLLGMREGALVHVVLAEAVQPLGGPQDLALVPGDHRAYAPLQAPDDGARRLA